MPRLTDRLRALEWAACSVDGEFRGAIKRGRQPPRKLAAVYSSQARGSIGVWMPAAGICRPWEPLT